MGPRYDITPPIRLSCRATYPSNAQGRRTLHQQQKKRMMRTQEKQERADTPAHQQILAPRTSPSKIPQPSNPHDNRPQLPPHRRSNNDNPLRPPRLHPDLGQHHLIPRTLILHIRRHDPQLLHTHNTYRADPHEPPLLGRDIGRGAQIDKGGSDRGDGRGERVVGEIGGAAEEE